MSSARAHGSARQATRGMARKRCTTQFVLGRATVAPERRFRLFAWYICDNDLLAANAPCACDDRSTGLIYSRMSASAPPAHPPTRRDTVSPRFLSPRLAAGVRWRTAALKFVLRMGRCMRLAPAAERAGAFAGRCDARRRCTTSLNRSRSRWTHVNGGRFRGRGLRRRQFPDPPRDQRGLNDVSVNRTFHPIQTAFRQRGAP